MERGKPGLSVGTMGPTGHGKTTLTIALRLFFAEPTTFSVPGPPVALEAQRGSPQTTRLEYETDARSYLQLDYGRNLDFLRDLIAGTLCLDGAILVVSASEWPTPEAREQVRLARQVGIPRLIVFLNKVEEESEVARLDEIERALRELLSQYGFVGDETPVIRGSARAALERKSPAIGQEAITRLLEALDTHLLPRPTAQDFLLRIDEARPFQSAGSDFLVTGRIEHGQVKAGDEVEIVGLSPTRKAVVRRVLGPDKKPRIVDSQGGRLLHRSVGYVLRGVQSLQQGQSLARPGSIDAWTRFQAEIFLWTPGEGGRSAALVSGDRLRLGFFQSIDVAGSLTLREARQVTPGANSAVEIEILVPLALEKGSRFTLYERGREVGVGVVTSLLG